MGNDFSMVLSQNYICGDVVMWAKGGCEASTFNAWALAKPVRACTVIPYPHTSDTCLLCLVSLLCKHLQLRRRTHPANTGKKQLLRSKLAISAVRKERRG